MTFYYVCEYKQTTARDVETNGSKLTVEMIFKYTLNKKCIRHQASMQTGSTNRKVLNCSIAFEYPKIKSHGQRLQTTGSVLTSLKLLHKHENN